jgi:hypothetical protein
LCAKNALGAKGAPKPQSMMERSGIGMANASITA